MHPQSSKRPHQRPDGRNAERRHADDPDQRGKRSINYGTPDEKPLEHITVADAKKYIAEGQFGENSMLPKMEAAVSFLEKGIGRTAVITSIDSALAGFQGKTGTIIE